jgi:hypothetical protein
MHAYWLKIADSAAPYICSQRALLYPLYALLPIYFGRSYLLFPEKEAKSVVNSASRKVGYPPLGEADPGGSGGLAPQKCSNIKII